MKNNHYVNSHDQRDMHQADIIAQLHKLGTTLSSVSRKAGLASGTLSNALSRPWHRGELIIAEALNMKPENIWPSRYHDKNGEKITFESRANAGSEKNKNYNLPYNLGDMHPADIIAALRKKNTNLAKVSRAAGLGSSTLSNALARHWPRGELIIAKALNMKPQDIWPSRYFDKNGTLLDIRLRGERKRVITSPKKIEEKTITAIDEVAENSNALNEIVSSDPHEKKIIEFFLELKKNKKS